MKSLLVKTAYYEPPSLHVSGMATTTREKDAVIRDLDRIRNRSFVVCVAVQPDRAVVRYSGMHVLDSAMIIEM